MILSRPHTIVPQTSLLRRQSTVGLQSPALVGKGMAKCFDGPGFVADQLLAKRAERLALVGGAAAGLVAGVAGIGFVGGKTFVEVKLPAQSHQSERVVRCAGHLLRERSQHFQGAGAQCDRVRCGGEAGSGERNGHADHQQTREKSARTLIFLEGKSTLHIRCWMDGNVTKVRPAGNTELSRRRQLHAQPIGLQGFLGSIASCDRFQVR